MSQGGYTHITRATGTVLTAAIYNADHQNHITNQNPQMTGGYSDNAAQMKLVTNPGAIGGESLALNLAGEIERLRYQIRAITGEAEWYAIPSANLKIFSTPGSIPLASLANTTQGNILTRTDPGSGPWQQSLVSALSALTPAAGDLVTGTAAAGGSLRKIDVQAIANLAPNQFPSALAQGNLLVRESAGAGAFEQRAIPGLSALVPASTDLLLGSPSGGGAPRRIVISDIVSLASASGVLPVSQLRLSLTTGVPVMVANGSGQPRLVPYTGRQIRWYNGTQIVLVDTGGELTQTLTDTTKSPAAAVANSNYDMFFWLDGATPRCTRGPAWTSNTSRGTGAGTSELTRSIGGFLTNANAITNGPAANRGTYVGTIRTNSGASGEFTIGGAGAGGSPIVIGLWNAYNRVNGFFTSSDNSASWGAQTTRNMNGSANNRFSYIMGLDEDAIIFGLWGRGQASNTHNVSTWFGLDGSTAAFGPNNLYYGAGGVLDITTSFTMGSVPGNPGQGWHVLQAIENTDLASSCTLYGAGNNQISLGMRF